MIAPNVKTSSCSSGSGMKTDSNQPPDSLPPSPQSKPPGAPLCGTFPAACIAVGLLVPRAMVSPLERTYYCSATTRAALLLCSRITPRTSVYFSKAALPFYQTAAGFGSGCPAHVSGILPKAGSPSFARVLILCFISSLATGKVAQNCYYVQ